jgi:hypothetical protein
VLVLREAASGIATATPDGSWRASVATLTKLTLS